MLPPVLTNNKSLITWAVFALSLIPIFFHQLDTKPDHIYIAAEMLRMTCYLWLSLIFFLAVHIMLNSDAVRFPLPSRANFGIMIILCAVVWFTAPFSWDYWALHPRMILFAFEHLFAGFRYNPHKAYLAIIIMNIFWFMAFAGGVALLKSSQGFKNLFAEGGSKDPYRSSIAVFGDAKWGKWRAMKPEIAPKPGATGIVLGEDYDPRERDEVTYSNRHPRTWGRGGKAPLIEVTPSFEDGHALIVSGSGGGKTAANVISTCLHYEGALVVIDGDREALTACEEVRTQRMGRKILEINFERACSIDLMNIMKPHYERSNLAYRDVAEAMLMMKTKNDFEKFYYDIGVNLMSALLEYFSVEEKVHPFDGIAEILGLTEEATRARFTQIAELSALPNIRSVMTQMATQSKDVFGWLQPVMKQSLNWMVYPEIRESLTQAAAPNMSRLLDADTDIFITIPTDRLADMGGYTKLILGVLVYDLKHQAAPDHRRMFIVDEAPSLGYVPLFESIRDRTRKYGIHLMLIFQTLGQLRDCYGQNAVSDWASVSARSFSAVEDITEAEEISKIAGAYTANVVGTSGTSRSSPIGVSPNSIDSGRSNSLQKAQLINPDEVRLLPADAQILLFRRQPPMICGKALAFRRKEWAGYPNFHDQRSGLQD